MTEQETKGVEPVAHWIPIGLVGVHEMYQIAAHKYAEAYAAKFHAASDQSARIAELKAALRGMADLWVSVCNPRGWEPDHVVQYTTARAALAKEAPAEPAPKKPIGDQTAQDGLSATTATMEIDTGDHVHHAPSGENWVVAYVRGDRLAWCGWPEGKAALSDCTLTKKATPEYRDGLLREMSKAENDARGRYARERLSTTKGQP